MRLIPDALKALSRSRLAEGDPLPPEDRVVTGSVLTLEDLYHTEAPRLHRFFARRADCQDANDLVQESFARLAGADAAPGRSIEQPEAYLSRTAANLLRNRAKSALQRSLARQVPVEETSLAGPDMIAMLEARDLLNRIQNALMRLSPKTRDIFLAHRVDGLSYNDIAKRTGLSLKGVEWHMTKAIAHLDRVLRSR
ncbi:RNA polymerase sigma factor [Sphingomonas sp. TDK1]|uniref:RNA polymerase sigma factor n=1 Tax=Sphingomonas sp. TDK1 TaxID=453247 RepID=UPI0007DA3BDB|nr:RNA polymerase sigma factor [Sphingomonas sp. TDK1]OAN65918.1 RNA polymerase subunit sigma-24 [Sphingomonas sp. TDK1]